MMRLTAISSLLIILSGTAAFTPSGRQQSSIIRQDAIPEAEEIPLPSITSRRSMMEVTGGAAMALLFGAAFPLEASAAQADCMTDCVKNCKVVVPNDTSNYCQDSCRDYCEQPDRRDGLSGSVSAEGGEVGILGGTFGQGTVVKGQDKPPQFKLPGLNFESGEGKKLLG